MELRNDAVFKTDPLLYHKFENMVFFPELSENYSFLIFFIKKGRNRQCKSFIFIEIVIINESWYNQAYIFLISELWSPISTCFDEKIKKNFFW